MAATVESPEPAPPLPPPPPLISFEEQHSGLEETQKRGKQVLSTISWLVDRMQEQHSAFTKLDFDFRTFKKEAAGKTWELDQKEELLEHRFELMEVALKKNSMMQSMGPGMMSMGPGMMLRPPALPEDGDAGDLSTTAKTGTDALGEASPASPPEQSANLAMMTSGGGASMGMSMGGQSLGADSMMAQNVTDLEAELRTLSFQIKKMESHMKHQEQQQIQRDQAQDELQRMEFQKMNRDIEVCIKEKELESFRTIMMSKMGHIEAEAKEETERTAKALKEYLSEKVTEVQSSIERIAESADKQVRLIDEKIQANDASDSEREANTQAEMADQRRKVAALSRNVSSLAEHVGHDVETIAAAVATDDSPPARVGGSILQEPGSPKPKFGASKGNGNGGELELRVAELERRIDSLDGGSEHPGVADATQTSGPGSPSPSGSRPSSRGQPLPARVEKLEDRHEELVDALEETLGIKLESDKEDTVDENGNPSPRPDSRDGQRSSRSRGAPGPDRLSTLEARVNQLAQTIGVELHPPVGTPPPAASDAGERELELPPAGAAPGISSARVELLELQMNEVASALGLTPEELQNFARADTRGNLAGRLVLRDEGQAMSPRMAGMIAGQEDRIGQMDSRMSELCRDLDDKFMNKVDKHDLRLRNLEDIQGVKSPHQPKGTNLDNLEKRMHSLVSEDLTDATGGSPGAAKAKAKAAPTTTVPAATQVRGATEGGTGGPSNRENEEMLALVMEEVRGLVEEANDMKSRLRQLDAALEALRAGSPAPVVAAALEPPAGDRSNAASRAAADAAKISEASAEEARRSAEECQRLKEELAEIVNAVNVPSVASMEDSLFDEVKPVDGEDVDLDDEVRDDAARQYVERQGHMEARLKQLEEQLDSASVVMPESQIFTSLKAVIKDVRRCLSRCELLYQLPEIKMYVKRFQRSLEVNAILHEKWLGPGVGGKSRQQEEAPPDRPGSAGMSNLGSEDVLNRDNELSRSAPDLRAKGLGRGGSGNSGKRDGVKKKPFRTVVDWCRPHTPLKIDPVFKGGNGGGSRGEDRGSAPHLPSIK